MTREQFMDMDDRMMVNVIFRPSTNDDHPERGYWPVKKGRHSPGSKNIGWRGIFYDAIVDHETGKTRAQALKDSGLSDEQIEAKYQDWIKSLIR